MLTLERWTIVPVIIEAPTAPLRASLAGGGGSGAQTWSPLDWES